MTSRSELEQELVMASGCPLRRHSLNQRAVRKGIEGAARIDELPGKVRRAMERQVRQAETSKAKAARLEAANLDMLFDDVLAGRAGETVVDVVEGQNGFVHEIGVVYTSGSEVI